MRKLIKLEPDPLSFSVVEIRFSATLPVDAFFGMIYGSLKERYPTIHRNKKIGSNDIYPKYAILDESFAINIGSNLVSFTSINTYLGWKEIFSRIEYFFDTVDALKIFDNFSRIGLRYINFFEGIEDIHKYLNLNLSYNFDTPSPVTSQIVSSFLVEDDILCRINVENNTSKDNKKGSIVDIDCSYNNPIDYNLNQLYTYIDKCHNVEKEYFVKVVEGDLLSMYNPQYDKL